MITFRSYPVPKRLFNIIIVSEDLQGDKFCWLVIVILYRGFKLGGEFLPLPKWFPQFNWRVCKERI
jgi:hypothetical protein